MASLRKCLLLFLCHTHYYTVVYYTGRQGLGGGVLDSQDHTHRRQGGVLRVRQTVRTPGANLGERDAPRFLFCVRWSGDGERDVEFVQTKSKHAMKQVLGIKNEAARMKVTPSLAVAPHVHGDDMRWNPNDDGISFNP